ncbi:HNH endonuclease [Salmonella enterica]|nr:HNH endonuclease [Salmonella enterica]
MSASWREFSCEDIDFPVWVSSEGEVRIGARVITQSNGRTVYSRVVPPRKLKPVKNSCGYFQIKIHSRGKARRFYVHRLVAALFVDNPSDLVEVDHLDGDKSNNEARNLRWVTRAENMAKCHRDNPHVLQNLKYYRPVVM